MQSIIVTAVVDEKRRIMIDVPDDMPTRPLELEVFVHPVSQNVTVESEMTGSITREWLQAKLRAAGLLVENESIPDANILTLEEEERLGLLLAGGRSIADLIDEDREERF